MNGRLREYFERDDTPAIYFSSHRFKLKSGEQKLRHGFFALTELQDPASGDIRPHEKTLDAPKEDRLKLMLACHAQLSPIFALYAQQNDAINRMLAVAIEGVAPFVEIEQDNGDEIRLWRINDLTLFQKLQREMANQSLLIADGHHRYEADAALSRSNARETRPDERRIRFQLHHDLLREYEGRQRRPPADTSARPRLHA